MIRGLSIFSLSLFLMGGAAAAAPEDSTKEVLARELLEVSGSAEMGRQVMMQVIGSFKSTNPEIPEEFWEGVLDKMDAEGLIELVLPVYVEHFTEEELSAILDFYRSPTGQSLLRKMPVIMQESMTLGEQWGQEIAHQVLEELSTLESSDPET